MAIIKATCQSCGDVELSPREVNLAVCRKIDWSVYSFTCKTCGENSKGHVNSEQRDALTLTGVKISILPEEYFQGKQLQVSLSALTGKVIENFMAQLNAEDYLSKKVTDW